MPAMISPHDFADVFAAAGRKPPVWVRTWATVTPALPLAANSGTYSATGASTDSAPASTSRPTATAVAGLPADSQSVSEPAAIATPGRASPTAKSATGRPSSEA